MTVSLTFLGGLGEIGRNCSVLEVDGRLALIDCGLMFPEEDMLGVDLVLPDFSSVVDRAADVECIVLTHAHEDHVGALGYFLSLVPVPVYGTSLTVELARSRIEEAGVKVDLRPVVPGEWREHGPFRFSLIPVSHSIPQGAGVAFDTPEGLVVHSGDFKLDPTPVDGVPTDLPEFAALGRKGVRLLLADSTNAELPGFVPSESSLAQPLYELVVESRGRLIAACFSSHLHRIQQFVDAAVDAGRYVAFLGRSMQRNVATGEALGVMSIPPDRVIPVEEVLDLAPEKTAIVCTGSQGEPFAALSLMANGDHQWVTIGEGDTVVMSARAIPGNETRVSRVINGLTRRGARVFHERNAVVHVSGHGAQEELKTFLNVVRPNAFVPIHGEYRHLSAHAGLARKMKVPAVFVCEDGDRIVLDGTETRVERRVVPAGHVFVEGLEVAGDSGTIRDRRRLRDDGVIIVTVVVDGRTGDIVQGPFLDSHGFMKDPGPILAQAAVEVANEIRALSGGPPDLETMRRHMVSAVRRTSRGAKSNRGRARKTVVIPIVLEM
jgi:ribonuclease J